MASLADELLNDFDDSGSEGEGEENGVKDEEASPLVGAGFTLKGGDAHQHSNQNDAEMNSGGAEELEGDEDEEEAKQKVEKMQLGGVRDVRSVASLMKTMEPVLEVSSPCSPPFRTL